MTDEIAAEDRSQADLGQSTTQAVEELGALLGERRTASIVAVQVALTELERAKALVEQLSARAEHAEAEARQTEQLVLAVQQTVQTLLADWIDGHDGDVKSAA